MFARKKIDKVEVPIDETLRKQLEKTAATEKQRDEMLKDAHLIEAARATGRRVVSLDNVREHFREVARSVSRLRHVCWVNPDYLDENPLEWLRAGAPADGFRKLCHIPAEE